MQTRLGLFNKESNGLIASAPCGLHNILMAVHCVRSSLLLKYTKRLQVPRASRASSANNHICSISLPTSAPSRTLYPNRPYLLHLFPNIDFCYAWKTKCRFPPCLAGQYQSLPCAAGLLPFHSCKPKLAPLHLG